MILAIQKRELRYNKMSKIQRSSLMYTIPYFLINEAKSLIKIKIIGNIADDIINSIVYSE